MTKITKAILLSALVYPGAGQIMLKRYVSGIIFILITTTGLYFIIGNIFEITFQIIEGMKNGKPAPDFSSLLSLVSQHDTQLLNNAFVIMVVTWLISIIHVFIVSKQMNKHF